MVSSLPSPQPTTIPLGVSMTFLHYKLESGVKEIQKDQGYFSDAPWA